MKRFQKVFLGLLTASMLLASACGSSASPTPAPAQGASADTPAPAQASSSDAVTLTMSWWGGDSRHSATQEAIKRFMDLNPDIKVEVQFSAWDGWEDAMATQFFAGTAPDINQINWNWITAFSSDGSKFADLNDYNDIIDLEQFTESALEQCVLAGKLQAIPISMTGRIFYWNESTFEKAGIKPPTSLAELYAAADTFKEKLGPDYYPLVMAEYDRAILLVYYLESIYGKPWVTDNTLNYTQEEIEVGMRFFDELEARGVIPTIETLAGDGAASLDKNPKWIDGKYAGIFEWDSAAPKFESALNDGQNFVVGDYFKDFGDYQGGFSKVSLAFAISETSPYKEQAARLIEFLLNDDEGTSLMGSERGVPLSKKAVDNCSAKGLLDETVTEANQKVLAWVDFPLDPKFEDAKLKGNPDGVYFDVFSGLSYKEYSASEAAKYLIEGINSVLGS